MANQETREGYEWWDKFCALPKYSFIKTGEFDAVTAWENAGGNWIEQYKASVIVDEMQAEINCLKTEIAALKQRQAMRAV